MPYLEQESYERLKVVLESLSGVGLTFKKIEGIPPRTGGNAIPGAWLWLIESDGNYGDADNNKNWVCDFGLRMVTQSTFNTDPVGSQAKMKALLENALDANQSLGGFVSKIRTGKWKFLYDPQESGSLVGIEVPLSVQKRITRGTN